jgi:hypothetical protein
LKTTENPTQRIKIYSHICLFIAKQQFVDIQLKKSLNLYLSFVVFFKVEPKKVIKETALQKRDRENVQQYITACKQIGVVPSSYVSRHINDKNLVIKSQPLGQKGARALCVSLVHNHIVEKLDLEENDIGSEGAISIAEMLEENVNISEVVSSHYLLFERNASSDFIDVI